ncbi:ankyrin repeat domain-containing protein [Sphingomonas sp. HDW15A]|uniref:ankyrin repeat domain-containing protein n=1 Tax=Sphingomonas sp. HDW15A TaxID=2714942 RepID=UPI00140A3B31|nr:ankyrin repeat domain-containing protein [Sphingomonas sp. HDW15A]QIK96976.1 ankyrin repeat domain-containing protein [Sphingomonas sp. HDW15A]
MDEEDTVKRAALALMFSIALAGTSAPLGAQIGFGYDGPMFLKAVREGNGAKVVEMVEAEGSTVVNYRGDDGESALHIVTRLKSNNWVGYLLSKGADPNIADRDGDTPLIIASRLGFEEGATRLLGKGANIDKANRLGETALIAAVQQRQPAMVRLLLSQGADSDKTDRVGYTARDYAKRETRVPELLRLIDTVKPTGAAKLKL